MAACIGRLGVQNPEHAGFGHPFATAVFAQRFHQDARLHCACCGGWGG